MRWRMTMVSEDDDVKGEEDDVDVEEKEGDDGEEDDVEDASLRSRNALQHVTRATLDGNIQDNPSPEPRTTLCASLCSRNACQDFTRATFYGNLQVKCRSPEPRRFHKSHFIQKFTGKMPGPRTAKISQEPLYTEIYRKNAGARYRDPHFVRACAVETHVKISQGPLYTEFYR